MGRNCLRTFLCGIISSGFEHKLVSLFVFLFCVLKSDSSFFYALPEIHVGSLGTKRPFFSKWCIICGVLNLSQISYSNFRQWNKRKKLHADEQKWTLDTNNAVFAGYKCYFNTFMKWDKEAHSSINLAFTIRSVAFNWSTQILCRFFLTFWNGPGQIDMRSSSRTGDFYRSCAQLCPWLFIGRRPLSVCIDKFIHFSQSGSVAGRPLCQHSSWDEQRNLPNVGWRRHLT